MNISVIPNLDRDRDLKITGEIISRLKKLGAKVFVQGRGISDDCEILTGVELYRKSDVIIAVGGDGTILHNAKLAAEYDRPVLGVNAGHLGYTAGLEKDELDKLELLFKGDYTVSTRMMLEVSVQDEDTHTFYCLNDAVISKGSLSRIINISVELEGQIIDYRADGVIFATPTGSTAYSVSAGGPVVDPSVNGILLTPICPHSLISRSVFISENSVIKAGACGADGTGIYLTLDGETEYPLTPDSRVVISKAERRARLIQIKKDSFYSVLNNKLMK